MSTAYQALTRALETHPGDAIRERRNELGISQGELAELSGVGQSDISRIENRRSDARLSTITKLTAALDSITAAKPSLANGGRSRTEPAPSTKHWRPSGRTKHRVTKH
jgi:transcriptional regulator with XRE-family HTH domain